MKKSGFSLIELLIGLVILSILLIFVVPFGFSIYKKNQLELLEADMSTGIRYSRNIALLYELPLALTPLPGAKDFSCGMILFIDNKNHQIGDDDKLIHLWRWQCKNVNINWVGFQANNYLLFAANLKNSSTSGHFEINVGGLNSKLVVNRYGRIEKKFSSNQA